MAKTVIKGRGSLIHGPCPGCSENISVFLKHDEHFKNTECSFCGSQVHGDGIFEIIREGHHVKKNNNHSGHQAIE